MRTGAMGQSNTTTIFRSTAALLAVLLAFSALAGGCNNRNPEVDERELTGYYEARHEGTLYVVGSLRTVDAVRAGKPPKDVITSNSPKGQRIVFENNDRGLAARLMSEYDRRHGMRNR
jgi:hypothetical protein